ncbi:hypothetical protein [Streptomyces sp. NPDC051921]|uniref:hypothetical protein n=1 Tax=Streptomyces sp. NPDC051921 TaxID=3155806 RepID=UPI003434D7FE
MFDFGVAGYRPVWSTGLDEAAQAHAARLGGLSGRTLTRVWLVWDEEDDEWFPDCPVLFDFAGEQVEINHHKFDDLSLTWNTIDPAGPVLWPGFTALRWRPEPFPALRALRGLALASAELREWQGQPQVPDLAKGCVDITFAFGPRDVTVFNALDENGLRFDPPTDGE